MHAPRIFKGALSCAVVILALTHAPFHSARAEQLPFKYYTSSDGLAYDVVARVTLDSRGLLWASTSNGLSRFDGSRFITYRDTDGLMPQINHVFERRDRTLWVATNGGGVYRVDELGARQGSAGLTFVRYAVGNDFASMRVNRLYEDGANRLWAGSDAGLYVLAPGEERFERFSMGFSEQQERVVQVWDFTEDASGALWVATKYGLVRLAPDGRASRFAVLPEADRDVSLALLRDRAGRIWVGHERGLIVFVPSSEYAETGGAPWHKLQRRAAHAGSMQAPLPAQPGDARLFLKDDGLINNRVAALIETSDGHIWVGSYGGLTEFDGSEFKNYTEAQGFRGSRVYSLVEARDGSIWAGTHGAGIACLRKDGFTSYRVTDGLADPTNITFFEDADGHFYTSDSSGSINRFDPSRLRFESVRPRLPESILAVAWNMTRRYLKTRDGEWWVSTAAGLFRFPAVKDFEQLARVAPSAHYTTRNGLAYDDVAHLFEDARGDLWFSTFMPTHVSVTRWERATGKFYHYSDADGLPSFNAVSSFREDAAGQIWISFREGGIARYRDGRFTLLGTGNGLTGGQITRLMPARDGKIWATTLEGLACIDDPLSEHPRVRMYTTRDGLFSNNTFALAEDARGRIYIATAHAIDRLDPATGRFEHFGRGNGVLGTLIHAATTDRTGALWFATVDGVMRYLPRDDAPRDAPAVFISGLRVAGQPQPVPALGVRTLPALELAPDQNNIQIDFYGLDSDLREGVRTQYRLEGAGEEWSAPGDERSITFAKLAPGTYRLALRAVSVDGLVSPEPASFSFTVLRPVWQRWWFIALLLLTTTGLAYALYRYRLAQLLKVERVRTRIATDLHDDIGASLSRMAILSEVVKQQTRSLSAPGGNGHHAQSTAILNEIADSARGLVDSMSDIVWSIDPRKDDLRSVVQRVRQFASDVLEPKGIDWSFIVPAEVETLKLDPDARRHIFLIFKEAVNNVARHADGARRVSITLKAEGRQLAGEVCDDGRGFTPKANGEAIVRTRGGNGLGNMRARAAEIGGRLNVDSAPETGTRLSFNIPLK